MHVVVGDEMAGSVEMAREGSRKRVDHLFQTKNNI